MYRHDKILTCFTGLIGFSDDYDVEVPEIDADLNESSSGRYVNELHELLTYENILLTASNFVKIQVKEWDSAKNYKLNAVVKDGVKVWRAIRANNNIQPVEGDDWSETNLFSAYLRTKYNSAVINLVDKLFTEKKLNEQARTLLDDQTLFVGHGAVQDAISNSGAFRGLKIAVKNPDTSIVLRWLGLQLTGAQADFKVYIYHSSRATPIKVINFAHGSLVTYQWHKIEETLLSYLDLSLDQSAAGYFYIGYYEADLTGGIQVISKQIDFTGHYDCGTCSDAIENSRRYNSWSNLFSVQSFYVRAEDLDLVDHTLWPSSKERNEDMMTPGLNAQFAVECDLSDVLCRNTRIFTDALAQQLKVDFLKTMLFTSRNNNQHEKLSRLSALALGDEQNPGELDELDKTRKAVSIDLNGLSKICSKCVSGKFKAKSVWG